LGWNGRLDACNEPPRGRRPAGDPRRGASAQAQRGTTPSQPAAAVVALLLFSAPGPARAPRAGQRLGVLSGLPARRETHVHAGGDQALYRGLVAARGGDGNDQLLPLRGATLLG